MAKPDLYGIKGQAQSFLKSYLTNPNQKWQVTNHISSEKPIICGVGQRFHFFLRYFNDLPIRLRKTKRCLFNDDIDLTASLTELENTVNSDLENL